MSRLKRLSLLLIAILITLGICGCMRGTQVYKEPIRNYLEAKYGCEFEVHQVRKAFNGFDGSYLHVICESEVYEDVFLVYCYPVGEKTGDQITIEGNEYVIYDDYGDVVFQNQLEQQLKDQIGNDVFLKCQITFSDYFITEADYKAGLKSCLDNPGLASHVTVYAVVSNEEKIEAVRNIVETSCLENNAYRQYLYFAITSEADMSDIQQHFEEDPELFDRHIQECDQIERVQFTLIKRDEGITNRSVEKEGRAWGINVCLPRQVSRF